MGPYDQYRMQQYQNAEFTPGSLPGASTPNHQSLYPYDQHVGLATTYVPPPPPRVDIPHDPSLVNSGIQWPAYTPSWYPQPPLVPGTGRIV
jgi:hypothetical protein